MAGADRPPAQLPIIRISICGHNFAEHQRIAYAVLAHSDNRNWYHDERISDDIPHRIPTNQNDIRSHSDSN